MTEVNHLALIVLAFSLGLSAGISLLLLLFRSRGEQLKRKVAEGGYRFSDSTGKPLDSAELMSLVATNLSPSAQSSPLRLVLLATGAALVAALLVVAVA